MTDERPTLSGTTPGDQTLDLRVDGNPVTTIRFFVKEDAPRLEVVSVDTRPEFQQRGHGTRALRHLSEDFPDRHLVVSPDEQNTDEGRALIARAIAEGIHLHPYACYWADGGCTCGLDNESP